MANYTIHHLAAAEYLAIHTQIRLSNPARAARFRTAYGAAVTAIVDTPEAWQLADDTYRFYRIKKFPYIVYYRLEGDEVLIAAVGHERQQFGFWKGR